MLFRSQFTRALKESGGRITECRMSTLGSEFCALILVAGSWDAIAKIEDLLPRLEERLSLSVRARRTEPAQMANNLMPYAVDVVSISNTGIVYEIVKFFAANRISIHDLLTNTYNAANTGTLMISLHLTINVPAGISIAALRGDFMDFCDQQNLEIGRAHV